MTEGAGARFTVKVSPAQGSALTVNLTVADAANSDFVRSSDEGDQTIIIPANQTSATHTVPTVNDKNDEANGDVTVTVTGGGIPGGYKIGTAGSAMVRVNDNDEPGAKDLVQMQHVKLNIAEFGNHKANGGVRVTVEIGAGASLKDSARTINYTLGGTATRGNDANDPKDYYIDGCKSSTCSVILPANRYSALITIYVNDDGLDENDETIILTLTSGTGYTLPPVNKRKTTVTIADDDTRGLTFHRKWADVPEGESETYTVKLASQPTAAVTVNIASNNPDVTIGEGKNPPSTSTSISLTFNPSGNTKLWSTARTVTVSAAQDNDAVDDTATLTYTTSGGDYGGANALSIDRRVSVGDDETADPITSQLPRISLTGGAAVTEGSPASFTVNADRAPTARITVNVEVYEPPGQDFVAASQERVRTVTLHTGVTSASFTVPTVNDNTDEDDGFVGVYVNDGTGYVAGQGGVVTVRDDDSPIPAAYFGSGSSSATEGDSTRNVDVSLTRPAPSGGLTLRYSVSGSATAGSSNDFTIQNSGTLSIAAGSSTATISVAINDDTAAENAETVILTLTGGAGYTVGSPSVHTLTITDDDQQPGTSVVRFSSASYSTEEGNAVAIQVNISPQRNSATILGITYNSGTASAGDYSQSPSSITIPANTGSHTFTVQTTQDSVNETNETFTVSIGNVPSGVNSGNPSAATVTINDDDSGGTITPPATPQVSINSPSVVEGDSGTASLRFVVSLSADAAGVVTVDYSASGGSATSGDDYAQVAGGTLTFQSGERQKTITVNVNGDDIDEDDETVVIQLSNPTGGAQFARSAATIEGTGRIRDDDRAGMRFSPAVVQIADQDGTQTYTVSLTSDPIGTVTATVASNNEQVATVSPAQLTFTSSNWKEGLEVTVTATGEKGSSTSIAHEFPDSADGGYASLNRSLRVYVGENVAQGINAWIGRFGGTVASDLRDAIRKRLKHTDLAESSVTIAGQSIGFATTKRSDYETQSNYTFDLNARGDDMDEQTEIRHLSKQEAFGNASFNLNTSGSEATGRSLWGQAVFSEFGGRDGERELDGKIKSAITGAEIRDQGWTAGATLSYTKGDGGYTTESGIRGEFESDLTALTPYGAVEVSEGLEAWGALGFGSGKLHTRPDGGGKLSSDLRWRMIAAGASNNLDHLGAPGGFELSAFADAFHARTESSRTEQADQTRADASQFRFGIDGRHEQVFSNGQSLTVLLDAALRQDTGVGDNGSGIDLGGSANFGISENLSAAVEGRVLVLHGADDHKEESIGFSMDYDDNRKTLAGASASFGLNIGNPRGADSLQESTSVFANQDESASLTQSWTAEYAYGVDYRRSGLVRSHYVQSRWDDTSRTQALGIRLQPDSRSAANFSVDAYVSSFQDRTRSQDSEMSSRLEATWRW